MSTKSGEEERLLKPSANNDYSGRDQSNEGKTELESEKDDKGSTLVIAFLLMLVFSLGNRITGRLVTYPMHNYPVFMNMMSVIVYIPICFAYIFPVMRYTNNITKEQTDIPKYKFAVMGFYDSVAGIMQTFAMNFILNSSTIVLVQQSAIPISMLISKFALQAQYSKSQYTGASIVLLGIVVVLLPTLFGSHPVVANPAASFTSTSGQLLWIGVLVISCIPMCLSSVYKEKALGEVEIDVVYLNGWVAVYQFLFALPLCIPSSLVINIPISGIFPNLYGGMRCYMGINSITEASMGMAPDECAMAPLFVSSYIVFNIIYNVLTVVILKHGSANILWMASTVIVPLSNVAFSLNFMPGHQPMTSWDIVGLVVIMLGLVVYRFMPQLQQCYQSLTVTSTEEEVDQMRLSRKLAKAAEKKQPKYVGLNQAEALNTFIDSRVLKEQRRGLYRSTKQIRDNLLAKLGIPPSPFISQSPYSRRSSPIAPPPNFLKDGRPSGGAFVQHQNFRSSLATPTPPRPPRPVSVGMIPSRQYSFNTAIQTSSAVNTGLNGTKATDDNSAGIALRV